MLIFRYLLLILKQTCTDAIALNVILWLLKRILISSQISSLLFHFNVVQLHHFFYQLVILAIIHTDIFIWVWILSCHENLTGVFKFLSPSFHRSMIKLKSKIFHRNTSDFMLRVIMRLEVELCRFISCLYLKILCRISNFYQIRSLSKKVLLLGSLLLFCSLTAV